MGQQHIIPIESRPGTIVPGDDPGTFQVNLGGAIIDAWMPAGYIPRVDDPVRVLVTDQQAAVLGPYIPGARPLLGTVTGPAVSGRVPVDTVAGIIHARFVEPAPTSGELVRFDWQTTEAWVWPSTAAIAPEPDEGDDDTPTPPPPPPPRRRTGTDTINARASSTWQASGAGWGFFGQEVRTWRYGSAPENRGAWFYGNGFSRLEGATITACEIYLPRRLRIGSYNNQLNAQIYRHTASTRPSGDVNRVQGPFARAARAVGAGATGWVELPASVGQALVDNGGGIGISGGSYLGFPGINTDSRSGRLLSLIHI